MHHKIFIIIIGAVFTAFAVIFLLLPRPSFSELERRDLKHFPEITLRGLADGSFMSAVSSWFSDSEPFRDEFMTASMQVKHLMAYHPGGDEDAVTFHGNGAVAVADGDESEDYRADMDDEDLEIIPEPETSADREPVAAPAPATSVEQKPYVPTVDENAKLANSGIIIVGTGDKVRALMAYGGTPKSGLRYASALNLYKETFGQSVKIYSMVVPLATEFYCPEKARKTTRPIFPVIQAINDSLRGVIPVDAYGALAAHVDEPIFLRTDHHWAPLGAYYATADFAKKAGVPYLPITSYEADTVHRFVGTMYGYSKDISVKNAPEDFIYYIPRGVEYNTTYITYFLDEDFHITGESKPFKGTYFKKFKDGASGAYCTFMGGDQSLVKVETSVKNGRRVAILKDSYGNAVPSFLFGSFEQVHVIDFRYFTRNIVDYVRDNGITDILFVHNIFNVSGSTASSAYRRFLKQKSSGASHDPAPEKPKVPEVKDEKPVDSVATVADTIAADIKPVTADSVLVAQPDTVPMVIDLDLQ